MPDHDQEKTTREEKPPTQSPPSNPSPIELKVKRVIDSDNTIDRSKVLNKKKE